MDIKAGDAFQLVHGTAGVAKTTTANHRNIGSTSCQHRGQDETHQVTDTAGGMFVENRTIKIGPFHAMTCIAHGQGELRLFRHANTLETHGHRESTYLGVIDLPARDTLYKVTYFASGQFPTVPLGFYEFSGQ